MKNIYPSKEALNQIVQNFLVVEGYKDAAKKFADESKVEGNYCSNFIKFLYS